jgi:hypothetical protein
MKLKVGMLALALLVLGGCAAKLDSSGIVMPTPSPGDIKGQIMSVTGDGFTICGVSDGNGPPLPISVEVCGSVEKAQAALNAHLPGVCGCSFEPYSPDDGGAHTPQCRRSRNSALPQIW